MCRDRRVGVGHPGPDRVVIDGVLFQRTSGRHDRQCAICDLVIPVGEERYIPVHHADRRKLVDGRHTRLCLICVADRLADALGAA